MTCQQLLNTIGLVLSMAGVLVIFLFGPPQPNHEPGVGVGLEDNTVLANGRTVGEQDRDVEKTRKHYTHMSKCGLVLVFIGFAFQLWAAWS